MAADVRNSRGFVVQIETPDPELMPAEVAEAAATYHRLERGRLEARRNLRQLEAEARTAERTRQREHADALVSGNKPPANNNKLSDEIDKAKAEADAYDLALERAAEALTDAVEAHRPDWQADLAARIDKLRGEIRDTVEAAADAWWRFEEMHRVVAWVDRFPRKPKLSVKAQLPNAAPILSEMLTVLDPPAPEPSEVTVEGDDAA